jgi:hypothetical protein
LGAVVTESKLVKDIRTGTEREVDIAIESTVARHSVMIAIECRDHGRPADIQWIDALVGKYRDLPVDKVVAVSRSGFSKIAMQRAAQVRITTITLEAAVEAKCIPSDQKRVVPVQVLRPGPPDIDVVLVRDDVERHGEYQGNIKTAKVFDSQGQFAGTLISMLRCHAANAHIDSAIEGAIEYKEGPLPQITVPFPHGTRIVADNGFNY